jgi:hypothetical protein
VAAITGTGSLVGVVAADTSNVSLSGTPVGTFASKDVANGISVAVAGLTISGAQAGNYSLTQPTGLTANITARPLTLKANNQTKTYGDTFTFTGTMFTIDPTTPMVAGETVASVTLTSTGAVAGATVGPSLSPPFAGSPYPIVASNAVFAAGTSASNYSVTYASGSLTIVQRDAIVAYIGQTAFFTSGSSSTTAQVTLTASVQDSNGSGGNVQNTTVTFTDMLSGKVLASGVKVSDVQNTDGTLNPRTGTANTIVTLSTGQYGAQQYLVQVTLQGGSYKNCQQTGPFGTYCQGSPAVDPTSSPYAAAHPTIAVMIPQTINTMQGGTAIPKLTTAAGQYGDASSGSYTMGMQYNNKGTQPQGQIQLILRRADGWYYIKSNSITSLAFLGNYPSKDATIYTKASIYRVTDSGGTISVDGNVTLRLDAHDGCTTPTCADNDGDTVGFTVLSSKSSSLYYSNNWVYDSTILGWTTKQASISGPGGSAIRIN